MMKMVDARLRFQQASDRVLFPMNFQQRFEVCIGKLITYRDLSRWKGDAGRVNAEREFGLDGPVLKTMAAYRAAGWKDA
jgi:hypothetical protein